MNRIGNNVITRIVVVITVIQVCTWFALFQGSISKSSKYIHGDMIGSDTITGNGTRDLMVCLCG